MISNSSSPTGVRTTGTLYSGQGRQCQMGFWQRDSLDSPRHTAKDDIAPLPVQQGVVSLKGTNPPGPLPPPFEMSLPSQKAQIEGAAHRSTVPRHQHRVSKYAGGGVSAAVPRKSHRYTELAPSYGGEWVVPRNVSRRARYRHSRSLRVFPATLSQGPPQGIDEATARPTQVR